MRTILLSLFAVTLYGQTAGQPLTCYANSGVPPVLRAEGYTELAGDIVITCTGGNPNAPFLTTIQLFVNTQITSRLVSSDPAVSEALLLIDEPGLPRLDDSGFESTPTPFCVPPNEVATCNPNKPGATYQQASHTVFRAGRGTGDAANNSLVWAGIPVKPPGPGRERMFRITNVRVNASELGVSGTLIPTQVSAFVSASPSGTLPIDNPQQTIGYAQTGLLFDVRTCNGEVPSPAGMVYSQCSPSDAQRQFFDKPDMSGTLPAAGAFRFREGFQTAFKTHIHKEQAQGIPGVVFNTESGFVRPETGVSGVADTGTRLAVRLSNVPAGVRIFVSARESAGSSANTRAVLVPSSPNGAPVLGSPSATRPVPQPVSSPALLGCEGGSVEAVEVPITQGSGIAVWEVTAADAWINETLLFTYGIAYRDNTSAGLPAVGSGMAAGVYAPFYEPNDTNTRMQGLFVAVPRFRTQENLSEFMRIGGCGASTVVVNFTSNVSGTELLVDGVAYAAPKSFAWDRGETHTIDVVPVQPAQTGVRRVFTAWSNGSSQRQIITVPADTLNIAAHFKMQYAVTLGNTAGGSVGLVPVSPDGYYDAGAQVQVSAAPLNGYTFAGWTGDLSGQQLPNATLNVVQPISATARFAGVSCIAAISPTTMETSASSGTVSISVSRPASCGQWTASSNQGWITPTSAAFTGNSTVLFSVQANSGAAARVASLTVAGQLVTVTQGGSCAVTLNGTKVDVTAADTAGQISVTSASCTWMTSSDRAWLQRFPGSGTGNGTVFYTVYPNFSSATRSGTISVGDKTFAVTQAAGTGTPDSRFIRLLYFNYFGRLPSDAEVAFQLGSRQPKDQLAMNFLNSPEFNAAGRFVAGLYVGLLNRDAEYGGWLFQRNALARGVVQPESLVANFLNSEEFRLNNGVPSNEEFSALLYRQILGRVATAEEVQWRAALLTNGMTRVAMARDLLSSKEFREGKNARLVAFLVHATLLNRDPTQTEFLQRRDEITADPSNEMVRAIVTQIVDSTELRAQLQ